MSEQQQEQIQEIHYTPEFEAMKVGCVDHRVRIIFWDPEDDIFIALTPQFLLEHGAPFNEESGEYLEYNSTHFSQ